MSYASQDFGQRIHRMGDDAEAVFEAVAPLGRADRYGWNRVRTSHMPYAVAATPDYVTATGDLVEVMGCSGDMFRAMKVDKWEAMKRWAALVDGKLNFFIWNSGRKEWVLTAYERMKTPVARGRRRGIEAFDDGNEYYPIRWSDLQEWADFEGTYGA